MFYTVKNTDGKIVARLRTGAQCAAFVARVGGDLTISDSADHTPRGINKHNEWADHDISNGLRFKMSHGPDGDVRLSRA